jgi:hypothetical protein
MKYYYYASPRDLINVNMCKSCINDIARKIRKDYPRVPLTDAKRDAMGSLQCFSTYDQACRVYLVIKEKKLKNQTMSESYIQCPVTSEESKYKTIIDLQAFMRQKSGRIMRA